MRHPTKRSPRSDRQNKADRSRCQSRRCPDRVLPCKGGRRLGRHLWLYGVAMKRLLTCAFLLLASVPLGNSPVAASNQAFLGSIDGQSAPRHSSPAVRDYTASAVRDAAESQCDLQLSQRVANWSCYADRSSSSTHRPAAIGLRRTLSAATADRASISAGRSIVKSSPTSLAVPTTGTAMNNSAKSACTSR